MIFHCVLNKNESGQNSKNQILHKKQLKITIFAFFVTTKIQKFWFSMVFHQKWAVTSPKIMIFSFFIYIQAKNEKNHEYSRGLIFPILSSPRPDFDQNFAFSHVPAGKISHKSDITIPFWDMAFMLKKKSWGSLVIYKRLESGR